MNKRQKKKLISKHEKDALNCTSASISSENIKNMAVEVWKLQQKAGKIEDLPRNLLWSIKKLYRLIEEEGFIFIDLSGRELDSGLEVDILDSEHDTSLPEGAAIIKEMVKPIVIKKNVIISRGEVIVTVGKKT